MIIQSNPIQGLKDAIVLVIRNMLQCRNYNNSILVDVGLRVDFVALAIINQSIQFIFLYGTHLISQICDFSGKRAEHIYNMVDMYFNEDEIAALL